MGKSKFLIILMILFFGGCASLVESIPGYKHVMALIVGETKEEIFATHHPGNPKETVYLNKGTSEEVEVVRYAMWVDSDILLYFYKNRFIQVQLIDPNSSNIPDIREDYKTVEKGHSWPRGYILSSDGKTASIKTLE